MQRILFPNWALPRRVLTRFLKETANETSPEGSPSSGQRVPPVPGPWDFQKGVFFEVSEAPQACCNLTKSLYYNFTYFCMVLHIFAWFCTYLQDLAQISNIFTWFYMVFEEFRIFPHIFTWFYTYFAYFCMVLRIFYIFLHVFQ